MVQSLKDSKKQLLSCSLVADWQTTIVIASVAADGVVLISRWRCHTSIKRW